MKNKYYPKFELIVKNEKIAKGTGIFELFNEDGLNWCPYWLINEFELTLKHKLNLDHNYIDNRVDEMYAVLKYGIAPHEVLTKYGFYVE